MRPFQKHPDLLPLIIDWCETNLPSYHIAEDLTGWHYPEKWITIQPSGGRINTIRTGIAQFDVNVYAETKPETFYIAMDAVKAFMQMRNFEYLDGVVTSVTCSYPADISDPISSHPRYVFDVNLTYRTNS